MSIFKWTIYELPHHLSLTESDTALLGLGPYMKLPLGGNGQLFKLVYRNIIRKVTKFSVTT